MKKLTTILATTLTIASFAQVSSIEYQTNGDVNILSSNNTELLKIDNNGNIIPKGRLLSKGNELKLNYEKDEGRALMSRDYDNTSSILKANRWLIINPRQGSDNDFGQGTFINSGLVISKNQAWWTKPQLPTEATLFVDGKLYSEDILTENDVTLNGQVIINSVGVGQFNTSQNDILFTGNGPEFVLRKTYNPAFIGLSLMTTSDQYGIHLGTYNNNRIFFGKKPSTFRATNNSEDEYPTFEFGEKTHFQKPVSIGDKQASSIYGSYMLSVDGSIISKECIIQNVSWADYVFAPNYKLKSLAEVKSYIQENNHLPGVPSEEELKETGLSISEMQKIQMEKIEELTLYMIQLKEENQELKEIVNNLSK